MPPPDEYDSPWNEALEVYLRSILEFCFPPVATAIDWNQKPEFLDKELQAITGDAALGEQRVDKLIKVRLRDGTEEWILVHVEVQHQPDADLPLRIYQYHHRVRDRFGRNRRRNFDRADAGSLEHLSRLTPVLQAEIFADSSETVGPEIVGQHPIQFSEITVVAKPGQRGRVDAHLIRVQLPHMEVHHEGLLPGAVPFGYELPDCGVRKLAKIVPTGDRKLPAQDFRGRDWKFPNAFAVAAMLVDKPLIGLAAERWTPRH